MLPAAIGWVRLGELPVDVEEIGCDYLSFSAHKFHGPQGGGEPFQRSANLLPPLIPVVRRSTVANSIVVTSIATTPCDAVRRLGSTRFTSRRDVQGDWQRTPPVQLLPSTVIIAPKRTVGVKDAAALICILQQLEVEPWWKLTTRF